MNVVRVGVLLLACALVALSCAGDDPSAARLVSAAMAQRIGKEVAPPEPPRPFTLPETPIVQAANAGSLPGIGEVTPDGVYTYALPIEVPPGRGVQPNLAITYSSRAGTGPLGVGFSLSGLSVIQRGFKSIAVDGVTDGIDLDSTDVFFLDGQRLVSVRGVYGAEGTEYRTEEDSFAKVVSYGSPQPNRFRVWLKDGRIRDYESMGPFQWRMTRESDRDDNAVTYRYAELEAGKGEYLLQRIEYLENRIELSYDTGDVGVFFTAGVRQERTRLLTSIAAYGPAPREVGLLWRYDLDYVRSDETRRAFLWSVKRCGPLGGCLAERQFGWSSHGGHGLTEAYSEEHARFDGARDPIVLDVDGDGNDEVLFKSADAAAPYVVLRSLPGQPPLSTAVSATGGALDTSPFKGANLVFAKPIDAGRDGTSELFAYNAESEQYVLYRWSGSGFEPTGVTVRPSPDLPFYLPGGGFEPAHFTDVDGDGLADLVKLTDTVEDGDYQPTWKVRKGLANGDFAYAVDTGLSLGFREDVAWASVAMDVQGDGRGGLWPKGAEQAMVPDDAGGFRLEDVTRYRRDPNGDALMADLNGDGLRDQVLYYDRGYKGDLVVSLNTGRGFLRLDQDELGSRPTYGWLARELMKASWSAADLDGDGRDELLLSQNTQRDLVDVPILATLSLYALWDTTMMWEWRTVASPTTRIAAVRTGDFNGDGLTDVMYFGERCVSDTEAPTSACESGTKRGSVHVLLQEDTVLDVVTEVLDDGGSRREQVVYARERTSAPAAGVDGACPSPQICHRRGLPVVRRHTVNQGRTLERETYYAYEDPRSDRLGRGFLGFGTVRVWEPQIPRETVTTFDHATRVGTRYPFAHRPATVTVTTPILDNDVDGPTWVPSRAAARVVQTRYRDESRDLNGGVTHVVFPHDWTSEEWEEEVAIDWRDEASVHITGIDGSGQRPLRTRVGSTDFDDWGGLTRHEERTVGGVDTVTTTAYAHRIDDWLVSLPQWQEIRSTTVGGAASTTRHTGFVFDTLGHLHEVSLGPSGSADQHATVTYDYDREGSLRTVTQQAAGVPARRVHLEYDGTPGHVAPSLVWNELGHGRWYAVHPGYGVILGEMDANGVQATWIYDELGRVVTEQADGTGKRTWSYEGASVVRIDVADETGASGFVELDVLGRPAVTGQLAYDGTTVAAYTVYDVLGRTVGQTRLQRSSGGPTRTSWVFDSLGRLLRTVQPDGATTRYEHTFSETESWSPTGSHEKRVRDLDDRVVRSVSYLGGAELATAYGYGPFDQVEQVTDPQGHVTSIAYDVRGRRSSLVDPDKGTTRYFYTALGELRRQETGTDVTVYERDLLGRATRVTSADGETLYGWDIAPHGVGQLARTVSPDGTITDHTYNEHGWPEDVAWTVRSETFALHTKYDAQGRIDSVAYPEVPGDAARFTVQQAYNERGYLRQVSDVTAEAVPLWTVDEQNDDGALLRGTYGNGIHAVRGYQPESGRLETLEQNDGGGVLSSLKYDYYPDGRVQHRTERQRGDGVGERQESYVYDQLHRLRFWTLSAGAVTKTTEYGFDDLGNLTRMLVGGVEQERSEYRDPRPHAISANRDGSFTHDARGRMRLGPGRAIAYTDFDLPREITTSAGTTRFDYDALGARVRKQGPAGTTITIAGLYERRETTEGTQHVFLVPGGDGLVAQVVRKEGGERERQFLHQDALGSVTLVTGGHGEVVTRRYYEPFGKRIGRDGGPPTEPARELRLGLTGHEVDDELGLINMRGRIYDPQLKRVLTPDPYVSAPLFGQSYNRYSYVFNDPVNWTDPSGYDPECPDCSSYPPPGPDEVQQTGLGGPGPQQGESKRPIDNSNADGTPVTPPPIVKSDIDGGSQDGATKSWRDYGVVQALGGFVVGLGLGVMPGGTVVEVVGREAGVLDEGTHAAQVGKALGEVVGGFALTGSGIAGEAASWGLSATGIGAVIGVPAAVVSAGAITGGAVNISVGLASLDQALSKGSGSGGGSSAAAPAAAAGAGRGGNKLKPDETAQGAHTTIKRDPSTGKVTNYETYQPQSNPHDPKAWESVKRYDGNHGHFDRATGKRIQPHVHDPAAPGGVRLPEPGEIPK